MIPSGQGATHCIGRADLVKARGVDSLLLLAALHGRQTPNTVREGVSDSLGHGAARVGEFHFLLGQ